MNNRKFEFTWLIVLSLLITACSTDSLKGQSAAAVVKSPASNGFEMVVHKSPTCGCCKSWVQYIEKAGFSVRTVDHDDLTSVKSAHGLTNPSLQSCHTASVEGYVIEGHVPVSDIERLLAERPDVVGLTAPGMPLMSPGMGSEIPKDYDVLAFDKQGNSTIYSSY